MDFFLRYKKLFFLIGFLLSTILIGYLIFITFFSSSLPKNISEDTSVSTSTNQTNFLPTSINGTQNQATNNQGGLLPTKPNEINQNNNQTGNQEKKTKELTNTASLFPTSNGNNLQFYNKEEGRFYRIDKDGNATLLSEKIFYSVDKVTWNPTKNKAILEYPDGSNIIYDFSTNKQITLPKHWKDFNFSPNGDQIVMKSMGTDPSNRWLAITNEDGSKTKRIEDLGDNEKYVHTAWSPNNQSIALYTEGIDLDRQNVYFVGLNHENFKSLIVDGRGFQPKWNPNGQQLLYSTYSANSNLKPNLWVANASGDKIGTGRLNLNIETWAEKCTFYNESKVYCAVPEKLEEGAGLLPELAANTKDNLYEINLKTGSKRQISAQGEAHNMSNITISEDSQYAFFTDTATNKIYRINIK